MIPALHRAASWCYGRRIAQIADMGYENVSDATVAAITQLAQSGSIDFVLHNGDVGYADGFMPHWDAFLRKVEPIAAIIPYMVSPGYVMDWQTLHRL
jgi:phosphodiesterase/alkaline phosphatase D-like protein